MADMRCYDDADPFGAECLDPLEELEQDLYHRLIEPRGANLDDPGRGLGIEDMLSGPFDSGLKRDIESELRNDPRVNAVEASLTELSDGAVRIEIRVEANEGVIGMTLQSDGAGNIVRVTG